jgi:selenocysteine lyase/cysteine desulfurase
MVARLASESQVVLSARNGLVRVSPHFYNTEGDIERLYAGLERLRAAG